MGNGLVATVLSFFHSLWLGFVFIFCSLFSTTTTGVLVPLCRFISSFSYPVELHQVQTKDGYLLTIFRIPHGTNQGKEMERDHEEREDGEIRVSESGRPVVLLMHGLLDSSFTWVVNGPQRSLAFMLAEAGFDVWMGNNRGTVYGRKHLYLNPELESFWKFSYDEMATFDLPDTIEYILRHTGQKKLSLVGHSEGTTQTWGALSDNPELASRLHSFVALGPVASVGKMTNPFIRTMAKFRLDIIISYLLGQKSFMCVPPSSFKRRFIAVICQVFPGLIDDVAGLICGKPKDPFDKSGEFEWGLNEPGGTSLMNVQHWGQGVRAGLAFQKFDYGAKLNLKLYHQLTPPHYDLSKIPAELPKFLFFGSEDQLVSKADLKFLVDNLNKSKLIVSEIQGYNHTDYLWDVNAYKTLYPEVIRRLKENIGPQ